MRRPTTFILTALAIFLAVGGVAQAATPFTAGSGGDPDVAVDEDGVGHVVWMQPGSNATVGYCRVPAGESACDRTHSLSFQGTTSAQPAGRALVFAPAPNKVVVVSACTQCPSGAILEGTNRWVSTDGGATFSASVKIGEDFESGGAGTWLEDADMFVAVTGRLVKATKLLPGPVLYPSGAGLPFITDPSTVYTPQVVRLRDTNTLVAASNDLGRIRYAVYTGGSLNPDAINSASPVNWDRDLTLPGAEPSAKESALNSGPRGV